MTALISFVEKVGDRIYVGLSMLIFEMLAITATEYGTNISRLSQLADCCLSKFPEFINIRKLRLIVKEIFIHRYISTLSPFH